MLSIDDDSAVLLEQEAHRSGRHFEAVVNDLLRLGLAEARKSRAATTFQVKPRAIGFGAGQRYDCTAALIEELEGPEHR